MLRVSAAPGRAARGVKPDVTTATDCALDELAHEHVFLGEQHLRNERRMRWVVAVSVFAMLVELAGGVVLHSMALLADGLHMASHAGVFLIAALAYGFARRHARDPRLSFGPGKVGDLTGFGSAIVLAVVAIGIAAESVERLFHPQPIALAQAIGLSVFGLVVSLVSAWLLHEGHEHHHGHPHHDHDHRHDAADAIASASGDLNMRAAYLHLVGDVLVSLFAVVGLVGARVLGWRWLDSVAGLLGAAVVARFAWTLLAQAGARLLDVSAEAEVLDAMRRRLEQDGARVTDLHVWRLGPGHDAVIASIAAGEPMPPAVYKALIRQAGRFSHVTVEVNRL